MQTILNDELRSYDVRHDETAIEVIRDRAGLTGTKLVCGSGVCGACTALVDGQPVCTCLLPAGSLAGRHVRTIEDIAPHDASPALLHPVQRAFMAHDALQCGFCTPGFVVEAAAFHDRRRGEHGTDRPGRDEVARALAGHLCRCGAYAGIIDAVQAACAGEHDGPDAASPRVEALAKVTGRARFTADVRHEGQLEGVIRRSPHAHARVIAIDSSAARDMPGVRAVVDVLGADRVVRYAGQAIVAVAAVDQASARVALERIRIDYDVLPASIGLEAARAEGAAAVYSDPVARKAAPTNTEGAFIPGPWHGNVRRGVISPMSWLAQVARSRIAAARRAGDPNLIEGIWRTSAQVHAAFEPHCAVARWEDDHHVEVHASTQACDALARELARHFDLPAKNVHVLCECVGGAFGAKQRMGSEHIAAIALSRAANAPVRVVFDRPEEMTIGGYRPAAEITLAVLVGSAGRPRALSARVDSDGGVSVGAQIASLMGLAYGGPVGGPPRDLVDRDVVSHMPPGAPFRGPGGPVACWALEGAIDELAHRTGEDPVALRRRWDRHALRHELYDWVESIPEWRARGRAGASQGRFRRGIGLAAASWIHYYHAATQVEVESSAQGLRVGTASQDMGNGTRTVLATAVADVFGLSPTEVHVQVGDSRAPRGPLSAGSRTTTSIYAPARTAALRVRDQLIGAAVEVLGLSDARASSGGIDHATGHLAWADAFASLPAQRATATRRRDKGLPAIPLSFGADSVITGRDFTGAAQLSEVEVDTRLGTVRVLRSWTGLAAGRIIAPVLARSQCAGGVIQGLGYALHEERQHDGGGCVLTVGLEDYRIPGIADVPDMVIHFHESGFEHVLGRCVGMSELSTLAVAASVGNAVFHATGWRPHDLPIRPQRVLEGLR
jgi:xanthine dehydrogenase YagR molybdenum-binding subunit